MQRAADYLQRPLLRRACFRSMPKNRRVTVGELQSMVFQFLRNVCQQNACEQAELILRAALDPVIASRARRGEFVRCLDHFDLLQTAIN